MLHGMTSDDLLGRVYRLPVYMGNTIGGFLFVTVAGVDPRKNRVRVHCDNGERAWWDLGDVVNLIHEGALVESDRAPFVHDRKPAKFRRKGESV